MSEQSNKLGRNPLGKKSAFAPSKGEKNLEKGNLIATPLVVSQQLYEAPFDVADLAVAGLHVALAARETLIRWIARV